MSGVTAVVLAGDRGPDEPLQREAGVPAKAFVPLAGRPMFEGVLDALLTSATVDRVVFCGPERSAWDGFEAFERALERDGVDWVAPGQSPCLSVLAALAELPEDEPVLVTTADHALLGATTVDEFVTGASAADEDVIFAVASFARIRARFPGLRKTAHRLKDGAFCGCNLFYFATPRGRRAADFWRLVEAERKRPWRQAKAIGLGFLLRYLTRRLTLAEATHHISERMGATIGHVHLDDPESSIDVDSIDDWRFVETILNQPVREGASPG